MFKSLASLYYNLVAYFGPELKIFKFSFMNMFYE